MRPRLDTHRHTMKGRPWATAPRMIDSDSTSAFRAPSGEKTLLFLVPSPRGAAANVFSLENYNASSLMGPSALRSLRGRWLLKSRRSWVIAAGARGPATVATELRLGKLLMVTERCPRATPRAGDSTGDTNC